MNVFFNIEITFKNIPILKITIISSHPEVAYAQEIFAAFQKSAPISIPDRLSVRTKLIHLLPFRVGLFLLLVESPTYPVCIVCLFFQEFCILPVLCLSRLIHRGCDSGSLVKFLLMIHQKLGHIVSNISNQAFFVECQRNRLRFYHKIHICRICKSIYP